jgi:hypothetical protein
MVEFFFCNNAGQNLDFIVEFVKGDKSAAVMAIL